MADPYKIAYHPHVVSRDIPKLPKEWKEKIKLAIETRLGAEPELYGKPLRRSLKGYRKLRVADYRVVFLIEKKIVKILIIAHRSIVYDETGKRL